MTVADRKASDSSAPQKPRRSWLNLFQKRGVSRPAESFYPQKPQDDIADLLVMSAVDQKTPAEAPGSADLLDALVQDHLARTQVAPAGAASSQSPAAPSAPEPEPAAKISDEDRVKMLQREINLLLEDAPAAAPQPLTKTAAISPPIAPAAKLPEEPAKPSADETPVSQAAPSAKAASADASEISKQELDVLLAGKSATLPPATETPVLGENEAEAKLTEAEGVLAEELTRLITEADGPAVAPAAAEPAAEKKSEVPAVTAVEAKVSPAPPTVAAAASAPEPAVQAPAAAAPAPVLTASISRAGAGTDDAEQDAPENTGPFSRVRHVINDVLLMLAQLIDLPFSWINELDKNILGVAAFLLLAGGMVMFVLARFFT